MAKKKIRIGVIFGGQSGEHEVSIVSALSIMAALDKNKYNVFPIGITKSGKWISGKGVVKILKDGLSQDFSHLEKIITPDPTKEGLVPIARNKLKRFLKTTKLDVIFPILHGTYGEDGTVQGLLELSGIPYIGANVLASAIGMDKIIMKKLFKEAGLPVVDFVAFLRKEWLRSSKKIILEINKNLNFPIFVKPANSGSSVGISKAKNRKELISAIKTACRYDRRIIVEKGINAREIEVSVLGNDNPKISVPGEIIPSEEFYDYNAKYIDGKSKTIVPAKLPEKVIKKIQEIALKAFKALDCCGMARVDFLIGRNSNKIYLSEINTIPGFTSISMYPKLWKVSGLPYPKLLDKLIQLAQERFKDKKMSLTSYEPKWAWYKE